LCHVFFAGDKHKVAEVVVVEEEAEAVLVVAEVISVGEAEAEVHQEVVAVDVVVALGEEGGDKTTFCNVSSALALLSFNFKMQWANNNQHLDSDLKRFGFLQ
jgi:hypothetical protein